jgi:tripartite-type tricarboxylate transporter receptor subunit TctC
MLKDMNRVYSPRLLLLLVLVAHAPCHAAAAAQTFPARSVRVIVTTSPGGGVDITMRTVGQKLTELWGRAVVVDNRTGASGIIGLDLAAKAPPDGHTLVVVTAGHTGHAATHAKLPYDLLRDFAPVTEMVTTYYLLLAHPSVGVQSVQDLVALAHSKPGTLTYGSTGTGQTSHLSWVQFAAATRMDLVHVPYKGSGQALAELLAGHIDLTFATPLESIPYVQANKLRALAVSSSTRSRALPDLPTVAESGVPGYEASGWYGVVAPAATPRAIVLALNDSFVRVLRLPEIVERFAKSGIDTVGSTPEQFRARLQSETERWKRIAKIAGIAKQ